MESTRVAEAQAPGKPQSGRSRWRRHACLALAAWLCLVAGPPAQAVQREYYFESIGSEQGLAQNTVNALMQDRQGFIWVATQGGLHRYDGYGFQVFQHHPEQADSLPESFVTALAQGEDGRLWVGTNTHYVAEFDPVSSRRVGALHGFRRGERRDMVTALLYQPGRGLWVGTGAGIELYDPVGGARREVLRFTGDPDDDPTVGALHLDQAGRLWAATTTEGLYRIGADLRPERIGMLESTFALWADRDQALWVGASDGVHRLDRDSLSLRRMWPTDGQAGVPGAHGVRAVVGDGRGRLWLVLWHRGLVRFDPASSQALEIVYDPEVPASLPEQRLTAAMIDHSGLLWLGGEVRGLATTHPDGAPFPYVLDLHPGSNRIDTNNLRVLQESADGKLWLGTEGDGLKRYDPANGQFERYADVFEPLLDPALRGRPMRMLGLAEGEADTLWVSGNQGLFHFDPAQRRARRVPIRLDADAPPNRDPSALRSMLRARDGSIWIGSYNVGLVHFYPQTETWRFYRHDPEDEDSLSHSLINTIFEDRRGRIWVGTLAGLDLLDPTSGRIRRFRHDAGDAQSVSGDLVRVVFQGRDDTLWIGTHSGLSQVIEGPDDEIRFRRYGVEQGLPNPTVYGIAEDTQGRFWISSNGGLASFERESGRFRRYGLRDGLQDLEFNGGAALTLRDGRIAFGGTRGFNLFDPARLQDSSYAPEVVLTSVRAGNHSLPAPEPGAELRIEQAARVLRLRYAALDFVAPAQNRFRYRLEDFDADWVEAGHQHDTTYTNLDPGRYTFRVQATNHDGVWSEHELAQVVVVNPPWWGSRAAYVAYALAAIVLVALGLRAQRQRRVQEQGLLHQIQEREERLKLSLWGSGDEFWDWDVRANTIYRIGADQLLGLRNEHEVSTDDWRSRAVHPDDLPRVQQILQNHIVGQTEFFESEHRIRNAQGEWIWVRSRGKVVERDEAGNPLRIAGTARDISAGRSAERDRRIALEVLRSMDEAVAVTDLEFRFVSVNPAFSRITGYSEEEVMGQSAALLNSAQHSDEFYRRMREATVRYGHWKGETWQRRKDGEEFLGWIDLSEVRDAQDQRSHFVAVVNDITDKKRAEQELRYLANYDTLTGLPNRSLLAERLARAVVRARRQESRVAVLFLDLDRFKDINDSLGHAAGDRILKAAAARLLGIVRECDTVARLGGDEFTVVVEEILDVAAAEDVAEKVIAAFAEPLEIDGRSEVTISPSIGISLYPDHGQVPTDLLKFADTAMYQAKDRGRNTFQVYTEAMDAEARRRAVMVAALRRALERGEFRLVYQPRMSLLDNRISGVEALLRWHSEELGEIPPSTFIPLAEETGLILSIGEWVLREACITLQRWRRQGLLELGMAVNVSVLQFLRGRLPQTLRALLDEIDVPPERIELEVTESMVMANAEQTDAVLRELKSLGVTLAIDDFGTGYSSLVYLKRLPIDTLKIDKEFVGDLTNDPDDEAITATVITMAHSLGLNVVAEGVETEEQLQYLREQGCDEIQGFWLARPLDVHHCLAFIRAHPGQAHELATGGPGVAHTA
jgi:diguanylate cyclase (GGDEF)-like protein/PAS domain S-box-containing protein